MASFRDRVIEAVAKLFSAISIFTMGRPAFRRVPVRAISIVRRRG